MASSKLNKEDAQEWLESLQQVGEGWYRQVQLAVRANAHKALGMERREFARTIGQRLIDPREAIIEMYQAGSSIQEISDILAVSRSDTVIPALKEAALYKEPKQLQGAAATAAAAKQAGLATAAAATGKSESERLDEMKREQKERAPELVARYGFSDTLSDIFRAKRAYAQALAKVQELDLDDEEREAILEVVDALGVIHEWFRSFLKSGTRDFDSELDAILQEG